MKRESDALILCRHVWDHNSAAAPWSWRRVNAAMHGAVNLSINAGLKFAVSDFAVIAKDFRMGYWGHSEQFFAVAVQADNISACQAIEAHLNRKPFTFEGTRVYVRRQFFWNGQRVTCTSFADDGLSFIAVSHKERKRDKRDYPIGPEKVDKRYTITQADLKAARAKVKGAAA